MTVPKVLNPPGEIWLTPVDDDEDGPAVRWVAAPRAPDDVRYVRAPRARGPAIWLNYGDLEWDATHGEVFRDGDVTWSEDQVFDSDVRYVMAKRKKSHLTKVIRERPVLTQARALELFEYDEQTGALYWKVAKAKRIHPGQEAGTMSYDGHVSVRVDGWTYQASHLAVLLVEGRWPEGRVEHLDGDNSNCAWENLRHG